MRRATENIVFAWQPFRWFCLAIGLFCLNNNSVSQDVWEDLWEWESPSWSVKGPVIMSNIEILDFNENVITSPSTLKPAEIKVNYKFHTVDDSWVDRQEFISLSHLSGDFNDYCDEGAYENDDFRIEWSIHVNPQDFYEASVIPSYVCLDDILEFDIQNKGFEGNLYRFWIQKGFNQRLIKETFMGKSYPDHNFEFEFSENNIREVFGFGSSEEILGSYNFFASVSTCSSSPEIREYWQGIQLLPKPPTITNVVPQPPECPGDNNGKIEVHYSNVLPNTDFVFTIAQLLKSDEGSNVEDWVNEINCNEPNAWCSGEYDLDLWQRKFSGNYTDQFDSGGNIVVEIDTSNFLDSGLNKLTLSSGLYAMRIETKVDGDIQCDNQYFIVEIPEPELMVRTILSDVGPSCYGRSDRGLEIEISGGSPPYTYMIDEGASNDFESKFTLEELSSEAFSITIHDNCGTPLTFDVPSVVLPKYETFIENVTDPSCNDGSFTVTTDYEGPNSVQYQIENRNNEWPIQDYGFFDELPHGVYTASAIIDGCTYLSNEIELVRPRFKDVGHAHWGQECSYDEYGAMLVTLSSRDDVIDTLSISYRLEEITTGYIQTGTVTNLDFPEGTQHNEPVPPGGYQLTLDDNCTHENLYEGEFLISPRPPVSIDPIDDITIDCPSDKDGVVTFEVKGGTTDYRFFLDGVSIHHESLGGSWYQISGLGKGSRTLEVTDYCGISFAREFFVLVENGATEVSLDQFEILKQISCAEGNDASIIVGVSGGTPIPDSDKDYQVSLYNENHENFPPATEGGSSEFYFTNLGPGNYYPVVKDNNGCEKAFVEDIITILPPKGIEILEVTDTHFGTGQVKLDQNGNLMIKCHGDRVNFDPKLDTDYGGGTGELTTKLELESVSVQFTNLGPGIYTFHVTDDNGCPASKQFEIREPEESLSAIVTLKTWTHGKHIKCLGDENGEVTVSISGGIPPYDFEINGDTEAIDYFDGNWTFDSLTAGSPQTSYTIVVTDYLGCQFKQVVNLEPPTKPTLDYSIVSEVVEEYEIPCTGEAAMIRFTGSGGDETSQYRLQVNGEIVGLFDPDGTLEKELTAGIYAINILDNLDCRSDVFELDLTEPDESLSFTTEQTPPNCIGGEDGLISIAALGGIDPYEYKLGDLPWQSENIFTSLKAGDYQVLIRDFNQCEVSAVVNIPTNPNPLTLKLVNKLPPSCHHGTNGSITVEASNFTLKDGNKLVYHISGGHYGDDIVEVVENVDPTAEVHSITFADLWDTKDPFFVAEHYEIWVEDYFECQELTYQYLGGTELALHAPPPIQLTYEVTAPSCYNGDNGWFEILVSGGVPPYEFRLDNSTFTFSNTSEVSNHIFEGLSSGDYMVYVRDANYQAEQPTCLSTIEVHVPQGMDMNVIEQVKNVSCAGGSDGAIEVEIAAFYENSTFEYETDRLDLEWYFGASPMSEGNVIDGLSKGSYTVKLSYDQDSLVCRQQEDIAILGPNNYLSITELKAYPTSCGHENDGRAILNFSGGWADSTTHYNLNDLGWHPVFGSSLILNDLSFGSHNIKIAQAAFECQDETTFSIAKSNIQIDTVFIQVPTCSDGSNGMVILKASNVRQPRFLIADSTYNSSSGVYTGLSSGKSYNLIVIDDTNPLCSSDTISFSFEDCEDDTEDVIITGIPIIQPATCESAGDGLAQVIAIGGLPPYEYFLDGDKFSSEILSDLYTGIHEVVVMDKLGKKDTSDFIMGAEENLSISSVNTTKSTCNGRCDGSAFISVEGGSGYSYVKWEDDVIGYERDALCPGTYSFQVIDERNATCMLNGEVNISGYEPLAIAVRQLSKPTCPGGTNGQIWVIGTGGSGHYSFEWSNGKKNPVLENISAGFYEVTLKDELLNCSVVQEIELPDIPTILITDTILGIPSCRGSTDGNIELVIDNATSPLVEWDDGGFGLIRKNLSAGSYHFTVTSSNSCQIYGEVELPERDFLSVEVTQNDNQCFGICEGTIDLSISGGLAPYYVEWESGVRSLHRSNLCSGIYDYQVVDRLGCIVEGSVEIRSPNPLAVELLEKSDVSCNGLADGSLAIDVSGGSGTYTYQWNTGNNIPAIKGLHPGNYTISISDKNGCSAQATYTIIQPQSLFLKYENVVDPSCDGKSDGLIEVIASGGNSSFQYTWDDFSTDPLLDGLYEGNYQLIVEDEKGCTYGKTYTLEAPSPLSLINVQYHDPICFDESSGLINTEVTGGTGPYTFSWNSGQSSSSIEKLPHGDYELTVTDENQCMIASSFHLSNPEPLSIEGIDESVLLCDGGSVFISPEGNWGSYSWEGPANFSSTSHQIEASAPGEYLLSVENEDGCGVSKSFSIERSESIMKADFIRISEALANEPLIFVDLSLPVPDQVEWIVPESDNIIVTSMDDQFIEIIFTKPGAYELGLMANYKNCLAELFKTIHIAAGSGESINARVDEADAISTYVYPNPTQGNIEIIIHADTREHLTAKLLNMTRDELVIENLSGKLDYLLQWDLSEVPSGVYFLVLQSGDHVQQKRILLVR